jgi:hypothetical protein
LIKGGFAEAIIQFSLTNDLEDFIILGDATLSDHWAEHVGNGTLSVMTWLIRSQPVPFQERLQG